MANRVDRYYDQLKKQKESEFNKQGLQQREALDRKAVSQGMAGSGAMMKLQEQQGAELQDRKMAATDDVEGQRALALGQLEEAEKGREFAKSEAALDRSFAGEQAKLGREFQTSERIGSQQFASGEAAAQRGFSKELFDAEMGFKDKQLKLQTKQAKDAWDLAIKQLKLDTKVSEFNMDMATKMWNKKDMMEFFANMHGYDPRTGSTGAGNMPGGFGGGNAGYGSGGSTGGLF